MSIKPIDLQHLLKQTGSVAKETIKEEKKRHNEKVAKDKNLRSKREDIIVEVGKTEVENTITDEPKKGFVRRSDESDSDNDEKKRGAEQNKIRPKKPPSQEPYKGNFLNITE